MSSILSFPPDSRPPVKFTVLNSPFPHHAPRTLKSVELLKSLPSNLILEKIQKLYL